MITSVVSLIGLAFASLGSPAPVFETPTLWIPAVEQRTAPSVERVLSIEELLKSQIPLSDPAWDSALPLSRAVNW